MWPLPSHFVALAIGHDWEGTTEEKRTLEELILPSDMKEQTGYDIKSI